MKNKIHLRVIYLMLILAMVVSLSGCGIVTIKPATPDRLQPTATPQEKAKPTPTPTRFETTFDANEIFTTEAKQKRARHIDQHIETAVKLLNTVPEQYFDFEVKSLDHATLPLERDKITNPDELYIYDLLCESAQNFTPFKINAKTLGLSNQEYNNAFFAAVDKYHTDRPELYLYADTYTDYGYDTMGFYTPGKWLEYMTDDIASIKSETDIYYRIIDRIIEKMPKNLTNREKCAYFGFVIASRVRYDHGHRTLKNTYQCFNALVYGSAVCGGYALSLQELCRRENIHCKYITGFHLTRVLMFLQKAMRGTE